MIPFRSSERIRSVPAVTLLLILINLLVFLYEWSLPEVPRGLRSHALTLNGFILHYGIVPDRFRSASLITSMFIHAGLLHISGNMWFLWMFGKAVEDYLGHVRFLMFYLLCGVSAGLIHAVVNAFSTAPTVGASGAIAGVMGAYLVKFPRARISTLVVVIIFITTLDLPAYILLAFWFVIQFFNGLGSIGDTAISHGEVAWFAHVGGFLAGMALILIMPAARRGRAW